MVRQAHHPFAELAEAPDPIEALAPSGQSHVLYKPRAQRDALGYLLKPFTVLDPIPEGGGQPHHHVSHPSTPHLPVPVVCV